MLPELTQFGSLRVLMTVESETQWRYALDLAQGLRAYDTHTTLCTVGPPPRADHQTAARRIPGLKLICSRIEAPRQWQCERAARAAADAFAAMARAEHCDVIHVNTPPLAATADCAVPVVSVCHSCVPTWWSAVYREPLRSDLGWHIAVVGEGLSRSDAVIAPTGAFAKSLMQVYGLITSPAVVYCGRRPCIREPLAENGPQPPATFAMTIGHLGDLGQDLVTLDRAAGQVGIPVFAAGPIKEVDGPAASFANVRHLADLTPGQTAQWLFAKPIFISTAVYDPGGSHILEAAETGCPLVLSDIPTLRELWDGAAVFVPPGDDAAAASAIDAIANDGRRRLLLSSAARRKARRYTAEVMAAKVRAIYGKLLHDRNARRGGRHISGEDRVA